MLQYKQHKSMEKVLIYDMLSENNQISQRNDSKTSKISTKETQTEQIIATKSIRVCSISSEQSPRKVQLNHESLLDIEKKQENIVFYSEYIGKSHSSIDLGQTDRKFIKRKVQSDQEYSDQYEDQVQQLQKLNSILEQKQPAQSKRKIVPTQTTLKNNTVIVTANVDLLIKQVVPKDYKLTCFLQIKKGLLGFSVVYRLFLGKQRQFLLAAKKETLKYYSNFLISRHHSQIHKRSQIYIGRLQSNFVGTQFKLFSAKDQLQNMKLLIHYTKNIVGFNGIRRMRAVKLNPQLNNHKYFPTLSNALERNEKSHLLQFLTAQPVLIKGKYRLEFKGKVKVPSSTNFILNDESGRQSLLFGKVSQNEYIVQVSYPLTIFQAFGLCLSSLDSKLMVN